MSITAKVEEGKIVLPETVQWPSGTIVRIEPVEEQTSGAPRVSPLHPGAWEVAEDFDQPVSEEFLLSKI
jgi:hypothetical protein